MNLTGRSGQALCAVAAADDVNANKTAIARLRSMVILPFCNSTGLCRSSDSVTARPGCKVRPGQIRCPQQWLSGAGTRPTSDARAKYGPNAGHVACDCAHCKRCNLAG